MGLPDGDLHPGGRLEQRCAKLLPVPYFHVVFTLPEELNPLAVSHPRLLYDLLFHCAAESLLEIAADPKHLGARIGVLAILHTWSQKLTLHPHLHCLVPAGGLSIDGDWWVGCRRRFFLPVRVLSKLYRGKLLAALKSAIASGWSRCAAMSFRARLRRSWSHGVGRSDSKSSPASIHSSVPSAVSSLCVASNRSRRCRPMAELHRQHEVS